MMNIVEQERACFDKEEQEEEEGEEEEEEIIMTTTTGKIPFPNSPNSSSSSTKYINFLPQHHNLWLSPSDHHSQQDFKPQEPSLSSFDKKLDLMDLSLGNDDSNTSSYGGSSSGSTEREHMFDKVVTPSDVGKLNRLVIPKQHAEKYFPLDSTANEKGLLLNFEDRNGKPWRFRYSYWNSSQSYVMTKGWSRFVKEKKLDAGDIVSFERGVGESGKHRLYIDWKRRSGAPDPTSFAHLELQNQLNMPQSLRWGKLYSLPHQPMSPMPRVPYQHSQIHYFNYHNVQPYHHNHYHHRHNQSFAHTPAAPQYYLTPPPLPPPPGGVQIGGVNQQQLQQRGVDHQGSMVFDSVPVVHGRSVGKRLRLFGVNMECPTSDDRYSCSSDNAVTSQGGSTILNSMSPRIASQSRSPNSASASLSTSRPPADHHHHEFSKKGKASLSFDLGL